MKRLGFAFRILRYWILGGRNPRPQDGSCFYCSAVPVDRYGVCQRCRERMRAVIPDWPSGSKRVSAGNRTS